jgi:hypothetical protein
MGILVTNAGTAKIEKRERENQRYQMKLECDYDLPVRKGVFLQLHFVLITRSFPLKERLCAKRNG